MISDRQEQLMRLHAEHLPQEAALQANGHRPPGSPLMSDDEVIALSQNAKNGPKFERLFYHGDLSEYGDDDSRADQGLVSIMAFYTQDQEQLDRLFRRSALYRAEKWGGRHDYRHRTIQKALSGLTEAYTPSDDGARMVIGNGEESSSRRPIPIGIRTSGRKPEVLKFSEMEAPGPRRYVLKDLVLAAYVTLLHGDGGVAKSLLALALAVAVSGGSTRWLGRDVENGSVLYLDFELDAEEQLRRVHQLCNGQGLRKPPEGLFYLSALGHTAREAFSSALMACEEHGVKLLILDSLGPALHGDAEASKDVIGFFQEVMEPFRAKGIAILIIDHQSKLQSGQSYQGKSAFGSVYKSNLARSVIQAEATERGEGTLTLRLRQKKHNFGPLAEPFGVLFSFSEGAVSLETIELQASELAEEATLTATERVKLVLEDGPTYPWEVAEATGIPLKTVKNTLTGLRKQGVVEPTGEVEGRTEQVRLIVPTSQSYKRRDVGTINQGQVTREPTGTPPLAVGGWKEV